MPTPAPHIFGVAAYHEPPSVVGVGLDETPHAYRRLLPDVLAAQEGTISVLHTLRPLVVVMAGADEFDRGKD